MLQAENLATTFAPRVPRGGCEPLQDGGGQRPVVRVTGPNVKRPSYCARAASADDAELLAAAATAIALADDVIDCQQIALSTSEMLSAAGPRYANPLWTQRRDEAERRRQEFEIQLTGLTDRIAGTPASTPEGIRAKARLLSWLGMPPPGLVSSLVADLLSGEMHQRQSACGAPATSR